MANEAVLAPPKRAKKPKPKARPANDDEQPLAINKSQSSLNEVLQQAYIESTQNEGKKKKKTRNNRSALNQEETGALLDPKLESLRKGESIRKDSDESLLLANTYDPDDDPKNKKSNKRRQQENERKLKGVENVAYIDETEDRPRKPRKKTRKPDEENEIDKTMTIEELAPPVQQKKKKKPRDDTSPETETTVPPAGRKKKPKDGASSGQDTPKSPGGKTKKQRDESPEPETPTKRKKKKKPLDEDSEQVLSEDPSKVTSDQDEGQAKVKKKKKKKKKEATDEDTPRIIEDQGRVISLCVHRTDKLKTDFLIAHPVVRISVIDDDTGNYLKKQHKDRRVTSYYEHDNVDFILPMMTQPFDFKHNKSTLPVWEEMLLFNENYDYCIQEKPRVLIMFEILDFMSMNATSQHQNVAGESGWHRIAWGFLKVLGANGQPNTDRKVRLQLYQPPVRFRVNPGTNELYQWYKSPHTRLTYPSTLYVTIKGIIPPDVVDPAPRSMYATQEEKGRITFDDMQKTLDGPSTHREGKSRGPSLWQRLAGQLCKVPNVLAMSLPSGKQGCYIVRFSLDGKYLACGCHDKDGYPIIIYEVLSGKPKGQFNGHFSIIYDICWSRNHTELLTASADGTARVWNVDNMSNTPLKTLPHPSFVYAARYHVRVNKVAVTGGYDRMIRIWTLKGDDLHGNLLQELDSHLGYVNTIAFDLEGHKMYTGDSVGQIKVWTTHVTDKSSSNGFLSEWSKDRDIDEPEFKGVAINCIKVHPSARRILVHTRDNTLRLYDLRIGAIMHRYEGALNFREHIRSTMTPCGSFIISGSEDSCAYVWNTDSGDQVASYQELGYRQPVCDVDYHPHDHMVAFCSFGDSHQVVLYKYDHKVAQRDVGIPQTETVDRLQKTGRPMSPEMKPGYDHKSDDEALETARSRAGTVDLDLSHSARMDRARRKLDSVMMFQSGSYRPTSSHPLGVPPDGSTMPMSTATWGTQFDTTGMYSQNRATSPEPSAFSPHASRDLMSSSIQQQQLTAQTGGMKQGGSWRPGFTGVGRHGSSAPITRPPISISTAQGKPTLQFHGKKHTKDMVVALYDYQSQRSDELTFGRGDELWVMCKDTDTWWLARNSVGEEGYIPANYVTSQEKDPLHEYKLALSKEDEEDQDVRKSTTMAVVSKSGELKFISAAEDSDAEPSARRKKKTRNRRDSRGSVDRLSRGSNDTVIQIDSETESVSTTRVHRKRRPKNAESEA